MNKLLDLLSRDQLAGLLETLDEVEAALGDAPHKCAVVAIRKIDEVREVLKDTLPGGWFGSCEACGTVLGCDDNFVVGDDVTVCAECAKAGA